MDRLDALARYLTPEFFDELTVYLLPRIKHGRDSADQNGHPYSHALIADIRAARSKLAGAGLPLADIDAIPELALKGLSG